MMLFKNFQTRTDSVENIYNDALRVRLNSVITRMNVKYRVLFIVCISRAARYGDQERPSVKV